MRRLTLILTLTLLAQMTLNCLAETEVGHVTYEHNLTDKNGSENIKESGSGSVSLIIDSTTAFWTTPTHHHGEEPEPTKSAPDGDIIVIETEPNKPDDVDLDKTTEETEPSSPKDDTDSDRPYKTAPPKEITIDENEFYPDIDVKEPDEPEQHPNGTYVVTIPTKITYEDIKDAIINTNDKYYVNIRGMITKTSKVKLISEFKDDKPTDESSLTRDKKVWTSEEISDNVNPDGSISGTYAPEILKIKGYASGDNEYTCYINYIAYEVY